MKLSLVSRGRNDDYGQYYVERTKFCLNRYISIFEDLGLTPNDIEIVFVDWGSEKQPMHTLMKSGKGFIRYIMIPREITKTVDPPETGFSFVHSINAGIVRCKGNFILHVDFDVYTDEKAITALLNYTGTLDANIHQCYFTRFIIFQKDYVKFFSEEPMDYMKDIKETIRPAVDHPVVFNGSSNAVMASKKAWFDVTGYDERYIYWGAQDVDLFTRWFIYGLKGTDLYKKIGTRLVHMEHNRNNCPMTNNPNLNPRLPSKGVKPNGPDWGLQNIVFDEIIT
jgi:predicted glycosyltransferase involved in capsule biosynthesis